MKNIYFDNASTTIIKPKSVTNGVFDFLTNNGTSYNRGSNSFSTDNLIWKTREKIAKFFGCKNPENIVFTKNITDSLNIIIRGLFSDDDHVIISNLEHNSVLRTIVGNKIDYSVANFNVIDEIFLENMQKSLKPNTKAVIVTHASNVSGDIINIDLISDFCKKNNLVFILDTAQTAGLLPISCEKVDIIAFTGHKTLYGIQGIGGFVLNNQNIITVTNFGGTGSNSSSILMPENMPYKFENGTPNIPGIVSLYHSFDHLSYDLLPKELKLLEYFERNIYNFKNIDIIDFSKNKMPISSLNFKNCDNSEACDFLNSNGIITRSGLHCAPLAHKALGTFETGTVRFSFDYNNTTKEIDYALNLIEKLSNM